MANGAESTAPTFIPIKAKRAGVSKLVEINTAIAQGLGIFFETEKETRKRVKKEAGKKKKNDEKKDDQQKSIWAVFKSAFDSRFIRSRDKLQKVYQKFIVEKKFFKTLGEGLKNLGKKATSWLMGILKFFLILAILDPKGKLFKSIVQIFLNIAVMLIKMLTKLLPTLITTMMHLIGDVLPDVIKMVFNTLLPALGDMFLSWGEELRKKSPLLGSLLTTLGDILKSPQLKKLTDMLANMAPLLILLLGALVVFAKILPFILNTITFIKTVWPIIKTITAFLTGGVLGTILAVVVAVVGFVAAVWIFAENISDWWDGLIKNIGKFWVNVKNWWKDLNGWLKTVITIVGYIFSPILIVFGVLASIVGTFISGTVLLAKFFKKWKKQGLKKTLRDIWVTIRTFFVGMWDGFTDWLSGINPFSKSNRKKWSEGIKSVVTNFKEAFLNTIKEIRRKTSFIVSDLSLMFSKMVIGLMEKIDSITPFSIFKKGDSAAKRLQEAEIESTANKIMATRQISTGEKSTKEDLDKLIKFLKENETARQQAEALTKMGLQESQRGTSRLITKAKQFRKSRSNTKGKN
jgi:hypothetical protein